MWPLIDPNFDNIQTGIPIQLESKTRNTAIIGIDTIDLNLQGGSTLVLHDVWHELSRPLILFRLLDEDDIRIDFSSRGRTLHKGNVLLARGSKVHTLYPLYVTLKEGDLFLVDILVSSLWHGQLGHLNKADITHLSKAKYILKLSFSDHQFCKHCQYDKQTTTLHPTTSPRESSPLDLVHFKGLWPSATSVLWWCLLLHQLH